jgi:myo-inositol catabolism protein IolC
MTGRGHRGSLFMLAFDHRASFQKGLFGIGGTPSDREAAAIADSKSVIYEGLRLAAEGGALKSSAALLVDEQFGSAVARAGKAEGYVVAMPVEKSGQVEFDFEYGDSYRDHIERFEPDFIKVLVRYNPDGDRSTNERQMARLAALSGWLQATDRRFLFELLVPAEPGQLAQSGGSLETYDRELRPELVVRTIAAAQASGVEPDIWKIEGLETRQDCERVSNQARAGGREQVRCIVLGRGENEERVLRWLRLAAGAPRYVGFAVGRTVWWDALKAWLGGQIDREKAVTAIAQKYRRMVDVYSAAMVS